jgi:ribonuclease VapC
VIIGTSAIVAILMREADAARFEMALDRAPRDAMSTATYVELANVVDRKAGADFLDPADDLLVTAKMELIPLSLEQAPWARHARLTLASADIAPI